MSGHMKRLAAPKAIHIKRKQGRFLLKSNPGPHPKKASLAIGVLLRDILKLSSNSKETRKIVRNKQILVDGVPRRDVKFPIGFMDTIEINKKYYRVSFDKKARLKPVEIPKKEINLKIGMITKKTAVKGKKIQLTLHDGRNILLSQTQAKKFKTGSSVLISLPDQKIVRYIPYEAGSNVFITSGRHVGQKATVLKILGEKVLIKGEKEEFETLGKYAFPTSKEVSLK